VNTLQEQAALKNFRQVQVVRLEIGVFAGVEVEAMRFGFDVVARGTLAEGAELDIIHVDGQAWCPPCGATVNVNKRFDACPLCGNYGLQVTAGEELRIKELEVQ